MQIRFTLDEDFDAELIQRIVERANGGRVSAAAKFLMQYWCEQENSQKVTPQRHPDVSPASLSGQKQCDEIDLAQLESALDQFENL